MTPEEKREWWGGGPWVDEADRLEWDHAGLPCLMLRTPISGHLCGYVAVRPGHPLHGRALGSPEVRAARLGVHGQPTFAGSNSDRVHHVLAAGDRDDVWWFGFDCMHGGDLQPLVARLMPSDTRLVYRDQAYVCARIEALAALLAAAAAV